MDFRFFPLNPGQRLRIMQVPMGNRAIGFGAVGSSQWFNPASAADRCLLLSDRVDALVETDSLKTLQELRQPEHAPGHGFVLYQHWWEPDERGVRPVGAMRPEAADPIALALKGGPTRNLMLITGGFVRGAIQRLAEKLDGHELDFLGLVWYFSGDDITDDPGFPDEIANACRILKVRRLSILTGAFTQGVETALAQGLKPLALSACGVFQKDDAARYPRYPTPGLDQVVSTRG